MTSNGDNSKLKALEELFRRFYKPLRAYAFRFVNDKDITKILCKMLFLNYDLGKNISVLTTILHNLILFKIVYNRSIDIRNKN